MSKSPKKETKQAAAATPAKSTGVQGAVWVVVMLFFAIILLIQLNPPAPDPKAKPEDRVSLSFTNWFNGNYQKDHEEHLKTNSAIGIKAIPLKNQIDFDWFHKINVNEFVLGKDDYVFNIPYINAYLGRDFCGDSVIAEELRKAQVVADTLKRKGIDLLIVFAPGKGTYCSEFLPEKYLKYPKQETNYEAYTQQIKNTRLHYIDFQKWFLQMKPHTQYPLFPQYGHHWSYYGECLAADSVISYIEDLKGMHLPHLVWRDVDYPEAPKVRDADILGKAKLKNPPVGMPMAYPRLGYAGAPDAGKVKTLAIADSYYRGFLYLGVVQNVFDNGKFWYYNNKVVPESDTKLLEVWELDLKKEIEKNQLILILNADATLADFSNKFIDNAYLLYTDPKAYYADFNAKKGLLRTKKMIRETPALLNTAVEYSFRHTIPVDSAITIQAKEILSHQ